MVVQLLLAELELHTLDERVGPVLVEIEGEPNCGVVVVTACSRVS
jgi:hypothetical protein